MINSALKQKFCSESITFALLVYVLREENLLKLNKDFIERIKKLVDLIKKNIQEKNVVWDFQLLKVSNVLIEVY